MCEGWWWGLRRRVGKRTFSPCVHPHIQQTQEISNTLGCPIGWLVGRIQDRVGEGGPWGLGLTVMKGLYSSFLMLFPNVCYKLTVSSKNSEPPGLQDITYFEIGFLKK